MTTLCRGALSYYSPAKQKRNHRDDPCGSTVNDYSIIALPPAIPFTSFHDEGGLAP
jgi:hypothetical protein